MKKYQTAKELLATKAENKEKKPIYATRKLSIGLVSCMLGLVMVAPIARAEEVPPAPGVEAAGQKEAGDNLGQGGQNIDTMGVDGLELGPEIVSQSVSATKIEAPTITEANAGTNKVKGNTLGRGAAGKKVGLTKQARVKVVVTDSDGKQLGVKIAGNTGSFNVTLSRQLTEGEIIKVTAYVIPGGEDTPILGESQPSIKTIAQKEQGMDVTYANISMPTDVTIYYDNNDNPKVMLLNAIKKANNNLKDFAKNARTITKYTADAKGNVTKATIKYKDNASKEYDISGIKLIKKEESSLPEINDIKAGSNKITGKFTPAVQTDTDIRLYINKESKNIKPGDPFIKGKIDKDGNVTFDIPDDKKIKVGDFVTIRVKEPGDGKEINNMEKNVVPKVPEKTGVRNPKNLTDEEKKSIIQKIRDINKDNGVSLLPEGSGEFSGTPALIDIDKNGNARIINPSNAYKDWVDYKPVFKKNPDGTYQVIDSDKISIIKAEDLLTDIKPDPPTITADDDKLTFAPKSIDTDAKTITINYDDPQGNKKTATITKNDGTWTSSDDNVTVDGGVISLLTSKVNPGSTVTATVTDNAGQTSEPNSQKIAESVKPPTVTPDKTTGKVTITPPVDVDGMEISYTPAGEGATETKIIAKKDNGTWKIDGDKPKGVEIDSNGVVTIDKGKAKEKSEVKAKSKLGTKESTESKGTVPDKTGPKPPEVKVDPSTGNVHITPPTDPDVKTIEVKYPGTDGHEKKFTATKTDTGWEFTGNNGETIEGQSGKITIPYGNLKKADTISAIAKDEDGNPSTEGIDTSLPPAPGVKLDEGNGVIIVTPPTEKAPSVDGMEITYTPAGEGTSETKLVAKKVGGKWSINNIPEGVKIDKNSGVVTITNDKAKAESKVVAYSSIDTNKKSKEKGEAKVPNTTAPEAPTVKVQDNGSVTITPKDKGETSVTVTYNKADATPVTVEAKKSDGQWKIENKTNGESVDPTTGVITIPTGNTNPGDRVKATAKKGSRTSTESNDLTKPAPPTVNPDQNSGNVTITPPTKGNVDGMIIKYKKPDKSEGTIKVKKGKGGTWTFDGENPDSEGVEVNGQSGVVTIKKGHAKEKTPVTADSTIENLKTPDINQGEQPKLVPDKTAPEAPTVTVDENAGNLTITPPSDDDTTSVTVTYKKDANTEIKVKAKKTGNTWLLTKEDGTTPVDNGENIDGTSGAITIPKGKYKTGEEVVAYGNDDAKNKSAEKNATPVEVSFDGNTGTGTMASKIVAVGKQNNPPQGQSAVIPAVFTLPECKFTAPDGKEFAGWSISRKPGVYSAGARIQISEDVTLTATWKPKSPGSSGSGSGTGTGTGSGTGETTTPGTTPEPSQPGNTPDPTPGSENPTEDKPTDPTKNPDQKDKPEDKKSGEDNKDKPKTPNVEKGDKVINVGDKEVVVPKVVVDKKKGKLDKEERTKIEEKIKQKNPDVVDVKIDEKANAFVTFNDGRRERILAKDLVSKEGFVIPRRDRHSQDESPNRRRAGKNVKTGVESIAGIACTLVASTGALYIGRKKED